MMRLTMRWLTGSMGRRALVLAVAGSALVAPGPVVGQDAGRQTPAWFGYERDAEWEPVVETITVEMDDGVPIACDHYRPGVNGVPADGPFPALMMDFVPYGKAGFAEDATYFAGRGYVTMACEVRGSGSSGGEFDALNGRELADNVTLIEWLGSQDHVNGRVGQKGFSYGGVSAYRVAGAQPEHLVAVAPGSAYTDWYRDWIYLGGARNGDVRAVEGVFVGTAPGGGAATLDATWSQHPLYDAYWRERSIRESWDSIDVPVLGWGGHYDLFPEGMTANASALADHHYYVVGPWQHETDSVVSFPRNALLAWFDHWVMQVPHAPLPDDRYTVFELPADDDASWVTYPAWPPPTAVERRLHMTADGGLSEEPGAAGERVQPANPQDPDPTNPFGGARPDQVDQTLGEAARTGFTTSPVDDPLTVAGSIDVTLRISLSGPSSNVVVRLLDVAPDGTSTRVTTGWLNVAHWRSAPHHTAADTPPTDRPFDVPVRLWSTHHTFEEGHSLRLSVSTGDVPRLEPGGQSPTVTIHTGDAGSHADVPVLGGRPSGRLSLRGVLSTSGESVGSIAEHRFARADTVLLARHDDYADGLAGGPLATYLDAPILLTPQTHLGSGASSQLDRLRPVELIVLGGEQAIPTAVVEEAARAAGGAAVRRIAGANRFATAALIAAELPPTGRVLVVEGEHEDPARGWPDALSAAGLAAVDRSPILLVNRARVPQETIDAIAADRERDIGNEAGPQIIVVGGPVAVSEAVASALGDLTAAGLTRLAGETRYETSTATATAAIRRGADPTDLIVVSGEDWRDGLAAGASAGSANGVLLLDHPAGDAAIREWVQTFAHRLRDVLLVNVGGDVFIPRS